MIHVALNFNKNYIFLKDELKKKIHNGLLKWKNYVCHVDRMKIVNSKTMS
jgi:hypothetical protein